jgi:hypothetical protein
VGKPAHQPIIELNGQRYNAQTGELIKSVSQPKNDQKLSMDGVARQPHAPRSKTASKEVHKTTQPGKTLMRRAVAKPSSTASPKAVAMDVMPHTANQASVKAFHSVSPERGQRAETTHQSSLVNRFGAELREATKPARADQAAATAPAIAAQPAGAPMFTTRSQNLANKMLAKGLQSANSHQETTAKKAKLRHRVGRKLGLSAKASSIAASSLAVLVIGGFFAYQNVPNLALHYAGAKAGVPASLPDYQPSGFTASSHIQYSPGEVAIDYKANADDRAYTVTQKTTNWNSEALKEHISTTSDSAPQTYPDSGRTIYLHEGSKADWVDKGVWYSISGDSSLNTDQLIKIADSL